VILPARITDPDLCIRHEAAQQVGADFQGAGAPERLDSRSPLLGDQRRALSEQQVLDREVVGRDPVDRQVPAGRVARAALVLGLSDRSQQRDLAVVVVIHADTQVHLRRTGIRSKRLVESEYRIPRRHRNCGKR